MTGIEIDKQEVKRAHRILAEQDIDWVMGHFVDLLGFQRSFTSPATEALKEDFWRSGISCDGSSVKGFASIERSDLNLVPDPTTLQVLPWTKKTDQRQARVIVNLYSAGNWAPFEGAPRWIAQRADEAVRLAGFDRVMLSPELEFHLFKSMEEAVLSNDLWSPNIDTGLGITRVLPHFVESYGKAEYMEKPQSGYFRAPPVDRTDHYRNALAEVLMELGVPVKYHHHENGSTQVEIEFRAVESIRYAADISMLYKFAARNIAQAHELVATFMPKPLFADAGNGMHVHLSLFKNQANVFHDPDDPEGLSQTARYFMGGILDHARSMCAITNPTINSYRRLVLGAEAPVYIAWSSMNRSALIRVPDHTDDPLTVNCEPRHQDTSANPHLAFALLVHAGLDGIQKKIDPGDPVNENIYHLSSARRQQLGIESLPTSLGNAIELMEADDLARRVLGSHSYDRYLELKKKEWKDYCAYVSPWEHYRYFDV